MRPRSRAEKRRDDKGSSSVGLTLTADRTAPAISPPEPQLTPDEMLARAVGLRALLRARQAECERGGNVPADVNAELIRCGFYRIVQPRRFGGYEFDVPTFYKVMMEIARGCSETAWVLALTAGHPLVAAFFSEEGQRDVYGLTGEFRCPAGFNPPGTAVPVDGGYRISGAWVSASGIDLSTHFVTMAIVKSNAPGPVAAILVLLNRDEFMIVDDWHVMGMQGTGSKSVVAKDQFVPTHRTAVTKGHGLLTNVVLPGPRIYENPMYFGRIGAFLIGEGASVAVGAARGALDLFEEVLRQKKSPLPPYPARSTDPEYHQHYGQALASVVTAEAALVRAGAEFMAFTREEAEGGPAFDLEREQRLSLIGLTCINLAWEAIERIYRTAGTSASVKQGQPIGRFFRNIAAIRTHPILQLDRMAMNAARTRFGLEPPL
jgi:3-hydroxy-9,10-secoandrosta-1,3,5(10)-triene-9,17-dione monooxygenase